MRKELTLLMLVFLTCALHAQPCMPALFHEGQMTECYVAQIDSTLRVTDTPASTGGNSVEPSVTGGVSNITNQKNNTRGTTDGHDWVNLGLPSGTLWATCNIGASRPEDCGDYFAWGELAAKKSYAESNYSFSENASTLSWKNDAASVLWRNDWRMPSPEQFEELRNECAWVWDGNNKGYKIVGHNGSAIFLPAAGNFSGSLHSAGSCGCYWSRTLCSNSTSSAWYLLFYSSNISTYSYYDRYIGQSVRPVRMSP